MRAELTETMLQKAMSEYLNETPDAVVLGGLIWTAPERVVRFADGLGDALARVIFAVIPPPPDDPPTDGVGSGVVSLADELIQRK